MLLYYVRHGDPVYDPDSLTPLGRRQAEAVAKRLARYGLDEIYVSSSNRAKETAQPTCDILKMNATELDWANEGYAWADFALGKDGEKKKWCFKIPQYMKLFNSEEIRRLGDNWYDSPEFKDTNFKNGMLRIQKEADVFFEMLGYRHDRSNQVYISEKPNDKRIALFAHQGFGLLFLSAILDICMPQFATHFDISHSTVTVIEFKDTGGITVPKTLMLSNDSHIYKEGLPTKYNNVVYI